MRHEKEEDKYEEDQRRLFWWPSKFQLCHCFIHQSCLRVVSLSEINLFWDELQVLIVRFRNKRCRLFIIVSFVRHSCIGLSFIFHTHIQQNKKKTNETYDCEINAWEWLLDIIFDPHRRKKPSLLLFFCLKRDTKVVKSFEYYILHLKPFVSRSCFSSKWYTERKKSLYWNHRIKK